MSWETINQILGLATVDDSFCHELLRHPLLAIQKQGFVLTEEEEAVISEVIAKTIDEFTRHVYDRLTSPKNSSMDSTS